MIYILIMIFGTGHGLSTFTQEFNTKEACQEAGNFFAKQSGVGGKLDAMVCVAKGEKK